MKILALLLCAVSILASATAQTAAGRKGFTFQVVSAGRAAPSELFYSPTAKGAPLEIQFHPSNLSKSYPYAGELPLVFYKVERNADSGEMVQVPVVTLTPQTAASAYILVFLSDSDGKRWSVIEIPRTDKTMSPTAIAFFNGMGTSIQGMLGNRRIALEPGLNPPQSIRGMSHKEETVTQMTYDPDTFEPVEETYQTFNEGVRVVLALPGTSRFRPFYDANITVSPAQSYMLLVFPPEDPQSRRYRVKTLSLAPTPPDSPGRGR